MNFFFIIGVLSLVFPCYDQFGFGGSNEPLYNSKDVGITLVNHSNLTKIVLDSDTAWMVEFYSSWCGHCIRFAPIFKELGKNVDGWKSMIRLAAIDCAQDENVATCRDYDIMGYPSLKFFPPKAAKTEIGQQRENGLKEIPTMMHDMAKYMEKISTNISLTPIWTKKEWPNFELLTGSLNTIWTQESGGNDKAILIAEENESALGIFAMMELQTVAKEKNILIRRGQFKSSPLSDLLKSIQSSKPFVVLSIEKRSESKPTVIYSSDTSDIIKVWPELRNALHIHAKQLEIEKEVVKTPKVPKVPAVQKVTVESEVKRRRYTAFMSDLENAILYSLSHEVGSRNSIVGPALDVLREYMDILDKHFPGRSVTMSFIHKLREWVMSHNDAIRGEDLIAEINDIRASVGAFTDTPNGAWMGCRGSKPIYGGYPCSLWTLWHVLTINQKIDEKPPHQILEVMVGYVKYFFGCQDCVKHFLEESENGGAVIREVSDKRSSILWLWRAHNKANIRLSGDITDDKAFPKEEFPNRQHCSDCYSNQKAFGRQKQPEFNLDKVIQFLTELYSEENLSMRGLRISSDKHHAAAHSQHEVAIYEETKKSQINQHGDVNTSFWGPIDMSLCFSIYLVSTAILIFVYFKFIAKKNICFGLIYNTMFKHQYQKKNLHDVV